MRRKDFRTLTNFITITDILVQTIWSQTVLDAKAIKEDAIETVIAAITDVKQGLVCANDWKYDARY